MKGMSKAQRGQRKENSTDIPTHRLCQNIKLLFQPVKLHEMKIMMVKLLETNTWNWGIIVAVPNGKKSILSVKFLFSSLVD